ncbi:MAG TPA: hypothetical protein VHU17_19425 [Acidimicrobiales bacterium]|jgi:hypothetical protein|nr:hypothetical protein [Acidimicrobiales bacterium]
MAPGTGANGFSADFDLNRRRIVGFLCDRGANSIPHPHGTLFEHLVGTEQLLRAWGCSDTVALGGLAHAVYGTDGFAPHLLEWSERHELVELAGAEVEAIVYLYASCDRAATYPQLGKDGPPAFRDRFTNRRFEPSASALQDFVDLTLANEIEIAALESGDPAPPWLLELVEQIQSRASAPARLGIVAVLGSG